MFAQSCQLLSSLPTAYEVLERCVIEKKRSAELESWYNLNHALRILCMCFSPCSTCLQQSAIITRGERRIEMKVTAAPPLHSVALVGVVLAICISTIPNMMSTIDDVATIEQCTSPQFPQLMTRRELGCIRCAFALLVLLVSVMRSFEP